MCKKSNLSQDDFFNNIWKKIAVFFLIGIIFVNLILYLITYNTKMFLNINEMISLSNALCIAIIPFVKGNKGINSRTTYIGIGDTFLCIFIIVKVILLEHDNIDIYDCRMNIIRFLIVGFTYFIGITIDFFVSIRLCKRKTVLVYIIASLFFLIYGIIFCNKPLFIVIMLLLLAVTDLSALIYGIKHYYTINKLFFLGILHIIFQLVFTAFYICSLYFGIEFLILSSIIRTLLSIFCFKITEAIILKRMFIDVHRKLVKIEKSNVDMNIQLKEQNKILTDFKKLIEDSESRYRQLLSYIEDGVIILKGSKVVFVNQYVKKILESDSENKILKFVSIMKNKHSINKNIMIKSGELKYKIFYVKINNDEEMIYIKDITQINKAYEARKRYLEFIQNEKTKNEFYSNISHELRTPINSIYSAIQLNELYIQNKNTKGIRDNYIAIRHNCLRLIRTISNFIDANKISEGYMTANLKINNIVSVIENISLACKKYIDYINDNLIFDSEEEEIYVKCDKDMIERVMMNLLSNIVKYGKPDGNIYINIVIKKDNVIIIVRVDNYVINEEHKKIMFDKFTKLNKEFTRSKEGSGLGLYLVRELLKLNNSQIIVETNNQKGTSFIIKMPISDEEGSIDDESMFEISSLEEKVDTEFSDIYL